jgi:heme/copper-type cytochrome/quinol oxidase subunit 2
MRHPVYQRLRPFLRRDLRARLTSALVSIFVLTALTWLGVSALSKIDSREAHQLRVDVGLEDAWAVCGGPSAPDCSYEDREQVAVDRKFAHEQRLRLAILDELQARTELGLDRLDEAAALAEIATTSRAGVIEGDTVGLKVALVQSVVDLRPAPVATVEARRERLLWPLRVLEECDGADFDGLGWVGCVKVHDEWRGDLGGAPNMRNALLKQIELERVTLVELQDNIDRLRGREIVLGDREDALVSRTELVGRVVPAAGDLPSDYPERLDVAAWLAVRPPSAASDGWDLFDAQQDVDLMTSSVHHAAAASGLSEVSIELSALARHHVEDLHEMVLDPAAEHWHGGWTDPEMQGKAIVKPSERYRSPVTSGQRWQIAGTLLLLLAGVMLVVVGPVVTATTTAREREAGTLPVLRMTGLSAIDLALAMTIGPNVFALVAGLGLLVLALPMLAFTVGPCALLMPLGALLILAAATHLTAIGLGDALGQRVNAMVVGGLLAMGLLVPGLVGAVMVVGDMAATGFLLGPLPATLGLGVSLSGLPFAKLAATGGSSEMGTTILGYTLVVQTLLGALCLLSWRRRVEQAWAPLFRPIEGAVLALASVGCSALAVLDLSDRINVQSYDDVNLITFVATGFLMPVLGWLLVTSLVRPARASAVASVEEVRRGFLRFQAFVVLTAAALAGAYALVLDRTGLASEQSEVMWATISQGLLIAQTAVATLLWASRRKENRHRIFVLGAAVVLLQIGFTVGVYNLEVEHVALTQAAGNPFLLGMDASPYWVGFLVLLWAAGLGLILAALLRERDRAKQEASDAVLVDETGDDGAGAEKPNRWLH